MRGCLTFILFAVLVFITIALWMPSEEPATPLPEHSKAEAMMVCRDAVRQRLKSPSTAKFGPLDERLVVNGADISNADPPVPETRYIVRSWVDAQNSFGAMIRTEYICTVEYVGGEKWRLLALTGLD